MSLKKLIQKTRLLLQHGIHESRQAISSLDEFSAMPVQAMALEERILMSASPVAQAAAAIEAPGPESQPASYASPAGVDSQPGLTPAPVNAAEPLSDVDSQRSEAPTAVPNHLAELLLPPAESTTPLAPPTQTTELVFVDQRVDDQESLLADLTNREGTSGRRFEIIELSADRNGLATITKTLVGRTGIDGIHILSHGQDGHVQLGSVTLSLQNLDSYRSTLGAWQGALSADADLMFYGCNLAASADGRTLMNQIAAACDCDVAASEDLTGHADLGGDWDLEYAVGQIESEALFSRDLVAAWYSSLDITSNLQAHYTFDTDASDSSGNNFDGSFQSDAAVDLSAATNQVGTGKLTLDGNRDRVNLNAYTGTFNGYTSGTIAAWVRTSSSGNDTIFSMTNASGQNSIRFGLDSGTVNWRVRDSGTDLVEVSSAAAVNDDSWHHVAVTVGSSGTRIFIDGSELTGGERTFFSGSQTSSDFFSAVSGISHVTIGAVEKGSVNDELTGLVDDFRIYDRALSASDIQQLYGQNGVPYALTTTSTQNGGLELNTTGGNDAILVADTGIASTLSAFTFELQFSGTDHGGDGTFVSYNTASGDELTIALDDTPTPGGMELDFGTGAGATPTGMDYRTLLDGNRHTLSVTWTSAGGAWQVYVDGSLVDSGTGANTGGTIASGGSLVFGQEQDSLGGSFDSNQHFSGTYYDARLFQDVRTATEIAGNYTSGVAPDTDALIAHWDFTRFTVDGVVPEQVSGNNLTRGQVSDSGFIEGNAQLTLIVDEHAAAGTVVGQVTGRDAERDALLTSLLAADPTLTYSAISNKFYRTVTSASTWTNASTVAQSATLNGSAGQLATIRSAAENEVVSQLAVDAAQPLWLGATDVASEGRWRWQEGGSDADQFWQGDASGGSINNAFSDWQSGRPDNSGGTQHYLQLRATGEWNDESDGTAGVGYVIEWDADEVLDGTQALTYSLAYQSVAGAFRLDADTGQITVTDGSLIDFESSSSHTLTVRIQDGDGQTYDRSLQVAVRDIDEAAATLWLNSQNNVTNSGAAGLSGWTDGQVLQFGGPAPTYESGGTAGEFSVAFDLDPFLADGTGRINALHFVSRDTQVGSGAGSFNLQAGDLVFSTAHAETVGGLAVQDEDILVFRPDSFGNWSSGTFSLLVDGSQLGLSDVQGLTLVEESITVGGALLDEGDLLIADDSMDVSRLELTSTGTGTAGSETLFLDGAAIGMTASNRTVGLHLNGSSTVVGDTTLSAGELLMSMTASEAAFGNGTPISVEEQDVVRLTISSTGGSSNVTATAWFDGSDVGLDTSQEDVHALALVRRQLVPVVTLPGSSLAYTVGDPATAIDSSAVATDPDSQNLNGGTVTVAFAANGTANDRLSVDSAGTGPGQISLVSNTVRFEGTAIGTLSGGTDGTTPLLVVFNNNATPAAAQALLRSITYQNVSATPSLSTRTVSFQLTDGDGGTSNLATQQITLATANTAPVITSNGGAATAAVSMAENNTAVTTVTATDADLPAQTLTYSITGGTDAARFAVDSATGNLTFTTAPDFESPTDSDSDNIYEVTVQVSDGAGGTDTQAISVTVTNQNDNNPVITSNGGAATAAISVAENNTAVTTVTANDADLPAQTLSYSITGGSDAARFAIDSATGDLTFTTAPDFGSPADANGDNVYEVTVQVSDGAGGTDTQAISVTVTGTAPSDLSTGVAINSNGGNDVYFEAADGGNTLNNLTAVTVEVAFRIDTPNTAKNTLLSYSRGINHNELYLSVRPDGRLHFAVDSFGSGELDSTLAYPQLLDGQVHHVAVTWDSASGSVIFYVDGVQTEPASTYQAGKTISGGGTLQFGQDQDLTGYEADQAFLGSFHDIRIWDHVRSSVEINRDHRYQFASGSLPTGLLANWQMKQLVGGTTVTDLVNPGTNDLTAGHVGAVTGFSTGNAEDTWAVTENSTNGTWVASVRPTDPDVGSDGSFTFAFIAGGDAGGRFSIDAATGAIAVADGSLLDYESSTSHTVTVRVTDADGQNFDKVLTLNVTDVNDSPTITSNGGATTASMSVTESNTAVTTVTAADADLPAQTLSYSITGGTDAARFAIDSASGTLTFTTAPDFESPTDANADNIYEVTVQVSDGAGGTDTQAISVTVTNQNDNTPVITSNGGGATATVNVAENTTAVTTVTATDADLPVQTLSYSITGGTDAARFTIDSATGALSFATAPDYEAPADANTDNVYEVIVQASDGAGGTDTQTMSVTVTNANEAPQLDLNGSDDIGNGYSTTFIENSPAVAIVDVDALVSDVDHTTFNQLTIRLTGAVDGPDERVRFNGELMQATSPASIDVTVGAIDFRVNYDGTDFVITRDAGGTMPEADLTSLLRVITYENQDNTPATGNRTFAFTLQDASGLDSATVLSVVAVGASNDSPVIASNGGGATASISVTENSSAVTTVTATDPESDPLSYSITGGTDAARFTIDSATGALSFATAPDFETPTDANGDNIYEVAIQVSDGAGGTDTQAISVTVTNQNDNNPVITSNGGAATAAVSVAENNAAVTTVTATDADLPVQTLSYNIVGGTDAARFTIDSAIGALSFATAPDFEAPSDSDSDNVYEVTVQVSDGAGGTDTQTVSVTVTDANEFSVTVPTDSDGATNQIAENQAIGQFIGLTAVAMDGDATTSAVTYSLLDDAGGRFVIDPSSGVVTTATSLDFETTGPSLSLIIQASSVDGSTALAAFSVTVVDRNESPQLTSSGPFTASENLAGGTLIGSVTAADPDAADVVSYSLTGTTAFSIDSGTGQLAVADATLLDFESQSSFSFTVTAQDLSGLTDSTTVTVNLTDVNEVPTALSLSGSVVPENSSNGTPVGVVTATDPDAGDSFLYVLLDDAGGRFALDPVTGQLSVASSTDLNFEASGAHTVTVQVSDAGGLTRVQSFAITVTDVNEAPDAAGETYAGRQLETLVVPTGQLLSNDVDPDGDPLSVQLVSGPAHGTLLITAAGGFEYTPTGTFNGLDQFTYQVTDGLLFSSTVTVDLNIAMTISGAPGGGSQSGSVFSQSDSSTSTTTSTVTIDVADGTESQVDSESSDSSTQTTEDFDQSQTAAVAQAAGAGAGDAVDPMTGQVHARGADQILRRTSSEQFVAIFLDAVPESEVDDNSGPRRQRDDELRSGSSSGETYLFAQAVVTDPLFDAGFDRQQDQQYVEQLREEERHALFLESVVIGSSAAVSTSISVGYVVWLLRGGSLLTTFLSSLPAWQAFDPLPVLDQFNHDDDGEDGESLAELVS